VTTAKALPDTLQAFTFSGGQGRLHALPRLAELGPVARLPRSLQVVLEALVRNIDDERVTAEDVRALVNWPARATRTREIPFVVARIVLQDFTGVPLLVDLAAMREAIRG
jgi:aconitate hydratase